MSTALRASFSFLKATLRFALLSLPNLPVSGENLNLWAAAALQRRSLLEGVTLRQWGWWLSFELDVLLLVAVTPLLLCCGVPRLLLFFQVMLAGGALSWTGGKCSPLRQPSFVLSHWVYAVYQHFLSSHLRWRSSPAVYVSLDGWCCGRRRCSWVAA
jgi:hypothetical protein